MLGLRYHDGESVAQMKEKLETLQHEYERAGLVVRRDESMSAHTSYQIGGPADLFVLADSAEEMVAAVRKARQHGFAPFVIGGGANLLVADAGIRGVVVAYRGRRHAFRECGGEVLLWSEAGALLRELARESVEQGLQGLEWAIDVPGTVGGAVVGNAGAFGGYICDCLRTLKTLEPDGTVHELDGTDAGFCYRGSRFKQQTRAERTVILAVTLALRPGDAAEIAGLAAQYTTRRWERHPREPSCGSVFKKSGNYPAGFLIEQCGLKGEQRGNAVISPKHANFVVNLGGAKAADVRALIELARKQVKAQFDQELELEVELVGEW
jgi:UDP-N-acetylmuramate dehydrogenase